MNGIRMLKPGRRVREYLPRFSTTKAFCCGTTTAVLKMTKTTTTARIAATRNPMSMFSMY
jgi:hypothetical protein